MADGEVLALAEALSAIVAIPPGVSLIVDGNAELDEVQASHFAMALVAGLLCIICVLIPPFEDLVTILPAVSYSFGGVFVALVLADTMIASRR